MEIVGKVKHPDWAKTANIYEVNIRQYSKAGDFKGFEKHLPRLKEMGVDVLWLMPIFPIGKLKRKGSLGSYYSVRDYRAVNPDYGTMDDLVSLVQKAHEMGMHVILDWVANHTAWDNQLIFDHPDWYTKDSLGNFVSPFNWSDVADLNYNNQDLRTYMINSMKFWVNKADIDGFRCDVAGLVPTDFWNKTRKELDKIKPMFMLAEAEKPELLEKAFDMDYGWKLFHIMNEIAKGNDNANDIENYFLESDSTYPKNAYRMYFTSNHDENSWSGTVYERLDDGAKAFAVLTATVPGMPLIYSGQEACLNKRLKFFDKDLIDWKQCDFAGLYATLLKLKKENKALWNGDKGGEMIRVHTSNDKAVYSFVRQKDEDKIFVVLNLTDKTQNIKFKGKLFVGNYKNVLTSKKLTFYENAEMKLEPWAYRVFEK